MDPGERRSVTVTAQARTRLLTVPATWNLEVLATPREASAQTVTGQFVQEPKPTEPKPGEPKPEKPEPPVEIKPKQRSWLPLLAMLTGALAIYEAAAGRFSIVAPIIWIIVGGLAGGLAGLIGRGGGMGLMGNIALGIVGAIVAGSFGGGTNIGGIIAPMIWGDHRGDGRPAWARGPQSLRAPVPAVAPVSA